MGFFRILWFLSHFARFMAFCDFHRILQFFRILRFSSNIPVFSHFTIFEHILVWSQLKVQLHFAIFVAFCDFHRILRFSSKCTIFITIYDFHSILWFSSQFTIFIAIYDFSSHFMIFTIQLDNHQNLHQNCEFYCFHRIFLIYREYSWCTYTLEVSWQSCVFTSQYYWIIAPH